MSKFIPTFKVQSNWLREQSAKALQKAKLDKLLADEVKKLEEQEKKDGTTKPPTEGV